MIVYIAVSSAVYYPSGAQDIVTTSLDKAAAIAAARQGLMTGADTAAVVEVDLSTGRVAMVWFCHRNGTEDTVRRERHGDLWWEPELWARHLAETGREEAT
jgi:hypothetical protein